jgi:cell wall-associated NlpC family hydrolase
MHWTHDYVGLPFSDGREQTRAAGVHCWGLVRLVLAEQCGIAVPVYGEISARDMIAVARRMGSDAALDPWRAVTEPREFDVALMTPADGRNVPGHAGIVTGDGRLLHITAGTAALCLPLSHWAVKGRVLGYFRHRDLDQRQAA